MLLRHNKWIGAKTVAGGFALLSAFPESAEALFAFSQRSYVHQLTEWDTGDIEISIPMKLQSCRGVTPGNWWGIGCEDFQLEENYQLTASDFDLDRLDNDGLSGSTVVISKVQFAQGSNSLELLNGVESSELSPGNYRQVDGTMTFTVNNSVLDQALPGTYRSNLALYGVERDQWTYDDTSNFSFDIRIPKRVRVSGLSNVVFGTDDGGAASSGWKAFCIFSQGGSPFQLKAYGQNDANNFVLKQGSSELPYQLWMRETGGNPTRITPMDSYQNWLGSVSQNCQNYFQNNMELEVRVQASDNQNASAGIYRDTVTIVVEAV